MSSKLKNLAMTLMILFGALSAHADDTMDALTNLQTRIQGIAQIMADPTLTNPMRLEIVKKHKSQFELELKQIIKREIRDPKTDAIHDAAYDKVDDMMLGMTALSVLKLNPDQVTLQEESYENARGILRIFSQAGGTYIPNPNHAIFIKAIELMHAAKASI